MDLVSVSLVLGFNMIENYFNKFLFVLTLIMVTLNEYLKRVRRQNALVPHPPSPAGSEFFFGHLRVMRNNPHLVYTKYARECGPIFEIFIGPKRTVILSDYNLVREAFKQQVFSGRPDTELTKLIAGYGVINSTGPRWKEQRAFLHNALRDFGARNFTDPNSPLALNIKKQAADFCSYLHETNNESVNVHVRLARGISNVIGTMLMSTTFEESPEFIRLLSLIDEGFTLLLGATYCNVYKMLKYIPYVNQPYTKIKQNHRETSEFFAKIAKKHRETFDEGNLRDIVDAFYAYKNRCESENRESYFDETQLVQLMGDLFSAGLETIISTLEWAFVYLIRNPDVQQKLYEEIESVVGTDRQPDITDMQKMPYMEATILEVQRRGNVISLGNAHSTLEDTTLAGYFIPKGTHVIANLWGIHMDPNLWDDPEAFKPERFIVDGKIVKPRYFMPFSVGRRMCVGDSLSRKELFHFLANIVQNFELRVPENEEPPSLEGISYLSLKPAPFNLCAVPRKHASRCS